MACLALAWLALHQVICCIGERSIGYIYIYIYMYIHISHKPADFIMVPVFYNVGVAAHHSCSCVARLQWSVFRVSAVGGHSLIEWVGALTTMRSTLNVRLTIFADTLREWSWCNSLMTDIQWCHLANENGLCSTTYFWWTIRFILGGWVRCVCNTVFLPDYQTFAICAAARILDKRTRFMTLDQRISISSHGGLPGPPSLGSFIRVHVVVWLYFSGIIHSRWRRSFCNSLLYLLTSINCSVLKSIGVSLKRSQSDYFTQPH